MKMQKTARAILADNVRQLRLSAGLSQEGLAEMAGFHRTYVSQLEREKCNISLDNLEHLAKVLGVHTSQLISEPHRT